MNENIVLEHLFRVRNWASLSITLIKSDPRLAVLGTHFHIFRKD